MKRFAVVSVVVAAMFLSACGGDTAPTTTTTTTTTTTAPETTQPATGLPAVEACIEAMNTIAAGLDLYADDASARVDEAFGSDGPEECAFIADGPSSIGLTDAELLTALEEGLNPRLFELMTSPTPQPFERTADEL